MLNSVCTGAKKESVLERNTMKRSRNSAKEKQPAKKRLNAILLLQISEKGRLSLYIQ